MKFLIKFVWTADYPNIETNIYNNGDEGYTLSEASDYIDYLTTYDDVITIISIELFSI